MSAKNKPEQTPTMREIKHQGKTLAIVYSHNLHAEKGIKFLTPTDYPLQIGLLEHTEGRAVPAHIHRDFKYNVNTTQEFLYLEKGRVDVTIFSKKWEEIEKLTLRSRDFILFVSCGHSVNIHKRSRIIEVKQGPYPGEAKAKIFRDK